MGGEYGEPWRAGWFGWQVADASGAVVVSCHDDTAAPPVSASGIAARVAHLVNLLAGVPAARLDPSDPAVCMFLAYLRGDGAAALAWADEVKDRCSAGLIRLRDGVFVTADEQVPRAAWRESCDTHYAWQVVYAVFRDKHRVNRPDADPDALTLSFAELTAYTPDELARFYDIGPKKVRALRAWLKDRGIRLRGD